MDNFDRKTTASFYNITLASDGMGGNTKTTTLTTAIAGCFWQNSAREVYINNQLKNPAEYTFACNPTPKIKETYICKIAGEKYTVSRPVNLLGKDDIMIVGLNFG